MQGQVSLGVLQHASPHGSQDGDTSGDGEGHLGRRGTADLDRVAFVCWAAVDFGLIGHAQQCAVGGHVAAAGLPAALSVEAREAWEAWEGWGEIFVLDWHWGHMRMEIFLHLFDAVDSDFTFNMR